MRLQRERRSIFGLRAGAGWLRAGVLVAVPGLLAPTCGPPPFLPGLVSSSPAAGAVVPRSVWPVLRFAADVPEGAGRRIRLVCDGAVHPRVVSALEPDALVVNPWHTLPADASCSVELDTEQGSVSVPFQTAPAGAPAGSVAPVYDRRDRNQPLPFPDDFWLDPDPTTPTGFRPNVVVPNRSRSVELLLSSMGTVARARADGWSPIGDIAVQLSGAPDPASLPLTAEASLDPLAPVALLDLTPGSPSYGQRVPFSLVARSDQIGTQPVSHSLVLFPSMPLTLEGRYGLVVTNRVLASGGEPFGPSAFFALARGKPLPGEEPEITRARPLADEVADAAEALAVPIPREDLVLAVRITVRSMRTLADDVLAMRQSVLAQPPNVAIGSVTPQASGPFAALVDGTFDAPSWGTGAFLNRGASGLPEPVGTQAIDFVMGLPRAPLGGGRAPLAMYQHGNPGSAQEEVPGGGGQFLALSGFAVAGFTDVLNRRWPVIDDQQLAIFGVLLATAEAPEFYLQTYAEQLAFVQALRSMGSLDLLPAGAPDGAAEIDASTIVYEGISYGSVHGQALLAYAPEIQAADLVAGASRLVELLEYQDRTRPLGGPAFLTQILPQFVAGVTPQDVGMGLGLFALVYDRQDPHNHARLIFHDPLSVDGTTRKASVLVVEGIGDSFTKNNTTRSLAWLLGPIPLLFPEAEPVSYLPQGVPPLQGNVDANTTAAMVQFVPSGIPGLPPTPGCVSQPEGHYCAQTAPESRLLRRNFLQSAVGGVPVIGP
jgi:hypothetical protein